MSVYVVAQGRIEDREKLNEYVAKALPTIASGGGRVIGFATDLGPPPGYGEIAVRRYRLEVVDATRSRLDLPGGEDLLTEAARAKRG